MELSVSEILSGVFVRMEPITVDHVGGLKEAAADTAIWAHMIMDASAPDRFDTWFQARLAEQKAGHGVSYAVISAHNGQIIGSTSFLAHIPDHKRVEIGHTWYHPSVQGTAVNPACKFLMLEYAFANGMRRVEFKTDSRNARSRAALKKLGAVEEGTMRAHMIVQNGHRRDSVYFSIIEEDWPSVREDLLNRLQAFGS